jgi:hypothetical protein
MSTWRVQQHYGFGGARIAIQPEAHRAGRASLRAGIAAIGEELTDGGPRASLRRLAGETPALLLGLLLVFAFLATVSRDHSDVSPVQVVLLESAPRMAEPPIEEPPSEIPETVRPEPPPAVAPKPLPMAERPKPPAPASPTRPEPAKPVERPRAPVVPEIARVAPAPAPRTARPDRPLRKPPAATPRPRIEVAALAPRPKEETTPVAPPPKRTQRVVQKPVAHRPAPRLSPPPVAAPDLPSDASAPEAFRVAAAKPRSSSRPKAIPGIAPAPPRPQTPSAPSDRRITRARAEPPAAPDRLRSPPPALTAPAVASRAPAPSVRAPRREARPARRVETRRAPRPAAALARAPQGAALARPSTPTPSRVERAALNLPAGSSAAGRPGLAGVPLGDLAACVSDREEDRLKQAVVAAVKTQEECVSTAGTYRFVETKNLNAFLMWIERADARAVEDRCGELRLALECLEKAARRAAR